MTTRTHTAELCIRADHPCLEGHFPGRPVVPAVVILDAVLSEADRLRPGLCATELSHAKFQRPLEPGAAATMHLEWREAMLHFTVTLDSETLASGAFRLEAEPST
jgi:3-hydroxymyristoyl/3-hydroxydecanoyl-(acyl carrier protein) dehydratase